MIGEVAAVLSAISALNSGIATLKEGKGNLDSIVGKWAEANEQYRDVEKAKAGAMSYKEALRMESAKRQLENFDQQLKDVCMMMTLFHIWPEQVYRFSTRKLLPSKKNRYSK